jgi:hypothetical protein
LTSFHFCKKRKLKVFNLCKVLRQTPRISLLIQLLMLTFSPPCWSLSMTLLQRCLHFFVIQITLLSPEYYLLQPNNNYSDLDKTGNTDYPFLRTIFRVFFSVLITISVPYHVQFSFTYEDEYSMTRQERQQKNFTIFLILRD